MEALTDKGTTGEMVRKAFDVVASPATGTTGSALAGTARVLQKQITPSSDIQQADPAKATIPSTTTKAVQPQYEKVKGLSGEELTAVSSNLPSDLSRARFATLAQKLSSSDATERAGAYSQIMSDPMIKKAMKEAGIELPK
jgi:cysteine synthase